jgi:hypothetical protein
MTARFLGQIVSAWLVIRDLPDIQRWSTRVLGVKAMGIIAK